MRASRSSARWRRRPWAGYSVAHEVEGEVVGGPAHPDAVGGVHRAGHVERRHRRLEPGARLVERLAAEQVVLGDADVVEREARRLVAARAHLVLDLEDLEARRVALDDERAVAAAAERRVDRRPHDDPLGAGRVRAEHLLARAAPTRRRPCGPGSGCGRRRCRRSGSVIAIAPQRAFEWSVKTCRNRSRCSGVRRGAQRRAAEARGRAATAPRRGPSRRVSSPTRKLRTGFQSSAVGPSSAPISRETMPPWRVQIR